MTCRGKEAVHDAPAQTNRFNLVWMHYLHASQTIAPQSLARVTVSLEQHAMSNRRVVNGLLVSIKFIKNINFYVN